MELSIKVEAVLTSEQIHNPQLAVFKTLAQSYLLPTLH
jgi:hypothetical protein